MKNSLLSNITYSISTSHYQQFSAVQVSDQTVAFHAHTIISISYHPTVAFAQL